MPEVVVAFDASTPTCAVVVGAWPPSDLPLLASELLEEGQASATLLDRVTAALAKAGAGVQDIRAVACGRGPGTFTGTRVAIASAMGLALGRGVPVIPVSTLAIVAASAEIDGNVRAAIDARRGEVYTAAFRVNVARAIVDPLTEEACAPVDPGLGDPEVAVALVGSGADARFEDLPPQWRARLRPGVRVSAQGLWRATRAAHAAGAAVDAADVRAVYLRKSYAEMGLTTPKRPAFRSPFLED